MRLSNVFLSVVLLVAGIGVATGFVGCGGSNNSGAGADGGDDGTAGDDGGLSDANLVPDVLGGGNGSCLALGAACKSGGDCCSTDCANGVCDYPACQSDNGACTASGQCCSQTCTAGKCVALNPNCSTLGNQCTSNTQCCSSLCTGGTCQPSSFCAQAGDACTASGECCTGTCTIASGQSIGTCALSPPSGPANCGMVDGQLCGGSGPDGGATFLDSGLPRCGGPCCSRACAPWGPTGVLVCQPASGCHVVGDLCTTDTDCCGSAGLPGGSGKPVTCDKSGGGAIGICRNPQGCKPDGDVCKLKTMSCNSSCDCCSGNCETQDTCKQDNVGVPRCAAAQCVNPGGSCASSANCCNGAPCVPNPTGNPPYVCYGSSCVPSCGTCTNNADCCPGFACDIPTGSTHGVCGPCGGGTDGGTGDGGTTGDSGTTTGDAGGGCALYGQICAVASDCCNGVPCTSGRCEPPIQ
ncbi:MAG TPA: hypothetical protein VIF15_07085 [Polyangiaceae bacterium]|jgi:hypothetical protein